jgi:tetratricopeptide (TPR) repeat protein
MTSASEGRTRHAARDHARGWRWPWTRCAGWLRATLTAAALAAVLVQPAAAQAEPQPDEATVMAARELAREGLELLQAGKYAEAQDRLHRAYAIVPAPTVLLLEGRALEGMGKLVEAAERYQQVKRTKLNDDAPEAYGRAVKEAEGDLRRVQPLIPSITIMLEGIGHATPGFEIRVDGVKFPAPLLGAKRPANPGQHEVLAIMDGKVVQRHAVALKAKQHERVLVKIETARPAQSPKQQPPPAAEQPPDEFPYRPVAWVSLGVGGAGLAAGAVFLAIMLSKESTLDENCEDRVCPPQYEDDLTMYRRAKTLSTVGFVAGALGVGAGFTILHLAPDQGKSKDGGQVQAWLGPGHVGFKASF